MRERELEANSGVFVDKLREQVLLLHRNPYRTYGKLLWDLMGGDIKEGEIPRIVFERDANEKLHLRDVTILRTFDVQSREQTANILRHVFVCNAKGEIFLDPRKYDQYTWVTWENIPSYKLTRHAEHVLGDPRVRT